MLGQRERAVLTLAVLEVLLLRLHRRPEVVINVDVTLICFEIRVAKVFICFFNFSWTSLIIFVFLKFYNRELGFGLLPDTEALSVSFFLHDFLKIFYEHLTEA